MNARYARNVILDGIGVDGQERLFNKHVLVIGLGGVGCYVATELAGLGINLGICDRDRIEITNLNRQFLYSEKDVGKSKVDVAERKITLVNPHIRITKYKTIDEIDFEKYNLVVDCTDNIDSRITISKKCKDKKLPLVYASAVEYTARVAMFTQKYLHEIVITKDNDQSCGELGIFAPAAAVAGSIAASETAKFLLGMKNTLKDRMIIVNLKTNKVRYVKIAANKRSR